MPAPERCLHAACTPVAKAGDEVTKIDISKALPPTGVQSALSADTLPVGNPLGPAPCGFQGHCRKIAEDTSESE